MEPILHQQIETAKPREPEHVGAILRSLGFAPDTEDRLRRLELAVAELAETWAEMIERQAALRERVEKLEIRDGALGVPRLLCHRCAIALLTAA